MTHRVTALLVPLVLTSALACSDTPAPSEPTTESVATGAAAASPLNFIQLTAGTGNAHTCGITTANLLYCWGANAEGAVGDGTRTRRMTPVQVAGSRTYRHVSAGYDFTCAVTTGNGAFCWGANYGGGGGQLGDGTTAMRRLRPTAVLGGHAFRQVTAGLHHACGITTGDRAWCWGTGQGAMGDGTIGTQRMPVAVAGSLRFRQVSAGWNHTCGVTLDDVAYCWGLNKDGAIGDGTRVTAPTPVAVSGGLRFRQVDGGGFHTCAVTTDNRAFCWGWNIDGQIGDGMTMSRRLRPRAVAGGLSFRRVEAGGYTSCGVTTTDATYCWGYNQTGGFGNGSLTNANVPRLVSGGHAFATVTTGGFHSCGVTGASQGYCWGDNFNGAIGDGTTMRRLVPTPIAAPSQ